LKKKYLLASLTGFICFFIFPNILGLFLWPLAWIALVPLLVALDNAESGKKAAGIAAFSGLAGYPFIYHWLVHTMTTYANMSYFISALLLLLLVFTLSLFLAGFGAGFYLLTKRAGFPLVLAAPVIWTAIEYLKAYFPFGGFPWVQLSSSQELFLPVIQISEYTGAYGVSFLIVFTNACLASSFLIFRSGKKDNMKRSLAILSAGILAPLAVIIFGVFRIEAVNEKFASQPEINIGVVQANIDQAIKWSPEYFWDSIDRHLFLTDKLMEVKEKPDMIIWPEAAVTVSNFNEHWDRRSSVIRKIDKIDAFLLTGALTTEKCGQDDTCFLNSAYLISPYAEKLQGRYDKTHLVPFGEYVPLKKLLFFADNIAKGNTGSTTPGNDLNGLAIPGSHFGCVICYEVMFPHLNRKFVANGAKFMTTITNDAWFGVTGAPYQHHSNVIFRAVENRVYFVRSANTGISSITDPTGKVLIQSPLYKEYYFQGTIKPTPIKTFYTKYGDLFAGFNSIVFIFVCCYLLAQHIRKRK
jgi:apolipoprotein N-acyltransferase